MNSCLIRQSIVDRDENVVAYKLLVRDGTRQLICRIEEPSSPIEAAANQNHLTGLHRITDGQKCFIEFNRSLLLENAYTTLDSDSTVVEVSESEKFDAELVDACCTVKKKGYALALDDYVDDPWLQPLLEHTDLLKVEFPILTAEQHRRIIACAGKYGFVAMAKRIDTQEDFTKARELGYTYFQGYYYCKPKLSSISGIPTSQLHYLRLLQVVNAAEFRIDAIEELIKNELSLTVKLLQYLNSPSFALRSTISSIRQAVTLLGQRPLQKWVSMITVSQLGQSKPMVLLNASLARAKFFEVIGKRVFTDAIAGDCFLVGMLSLLDAILDVPMAEILCNLALAPSIVAPLLGSESPLNQLLDLTRALDEGEWRLISALASQMKIDENSVFAAYEDAIVWASEVTDNIK
jgi:c-di-GMP-related signal transduction protein